MGETHFPILDLNKGLSKDEVDFEVDVDFDIETYCKDRKVVIYPAADIASDPDYSENFLQLRPGKAVLEDVVGDGRIRFKDKDGNLAQIKYNDILLETLCPKAYKTYKKVFDTLQENQTRQTGPTTLQELRGICNQRRDELLDQIQTKFAEMGFDFQSQKETNEAFEGAGRAWAKLAAEKYKARHEPKKKIEL